MNDGYYNNENWLWNSIYNSDEVKTVNWDLYGLNSSTRNLFC